MKTLVAVATLAFAMAASAQTTVQDAWIRGTVPQQQATGMYARLTSAQGGRLVAVQTPLAAHAEVHEMKMEGNVMRMRAVDGGLELPAGQPVELKPGGMHVMLLGLKRPLQAGERVPLTLTVEHPDKSRETVQVQATVKALGSVD